MSFVKLKIMKIEMPSSAERNRMDLHHCQEMVAKLTVSAQGQLMEAINLEITEEVMEWA